MEQSCLRTYHPTLLKVSPAPESGRPRTGLRATAPASLQPGMVHWEHNIEFAHFSNDDTKVSLIFARPSPSPSRRLQIRRRRRRCGWRAVVHAQAGVACTAGLYMRDIRRDPAYSTLGDANGSATGRDGNEGLGEEEAMAARAEMATLGVALAEANTDSELLEHVREYETARQERTREEWEVAMEILDIFWSDSGPAAAAAKLKELMGVGAPPE
jgi:hypothetical protein